MAEEQTIGVSSQEEVEVAEQERVSCHIYILAEAYEQILKWAEYAALEGLIEGHPRGNFSSYCNFCFNLGEQTLKRYMLTKRGYK